MEDACSFCNHRCSYDTVSLLEEYQKSARIPVKMPQNSGRLRFADNVLQAEARCNGDWMAFSEQDDVCFPEELLVSEGMENTRARMVQAAAKPQER